jgi:hypothetical protein
MPDLLEKQPAESRLYTMSFAPKMEDSESITGVNSVAQVLVDDDGTESATTDLTFANPPSASGQNAQQRIAAGLDGNTYKVTFLVTTSLANVLEADGFLHVCDL